MYSVEFIDISVDLVGMQYPIVNCNNILFHNDDMSLFYSNENHQLSIKNNDDGLITVFDDVYLTHYDKDQSKAIFSHVNQDDFNELKQSFSQSDLFTIIGFKNTENENVSLVNVDYSQFIQCSTGENSLDPTSTS